jgi:hypothetical protein
LRHRAFKSINEKANAIRHFQNPFHLTTEVGVTRGINYINFYTLVSYRCVLAEDRDPSLALQVIAIHDQVTGFLVIPENLCGVQDLVYQGSLTVVNVGNDCDISYFHIIFQAGISLPQGLFLRLRRYVN